MKKLKFIIALFCILISFPLTFVIWRTSVGLEREERSQMRFFAETLFDQMEKELADLVQREEGRAVDEYGHFLAQASGSGKKTKLSPLARADYQEYIQGYLQNNPDGAFQTPLVADMGRVPENMRRRIARLKEANRLFNQKKLSASSSPISKVEKRVKGVDAKAEKSLSARYLKTENKKASMQYLGRKKKRVEEITLQQAYNIAGQEDSVAMNEMKAESQAGMAPAPVPQTRNGEGARSRSPLLRQEYERRDSDKERVGNKAGRPADTDAFQVEVAPFQSVSIDKTRVFVFRRIGIDNQIYRQGFVVLVKPLMQHLSRQYFAGQPLAGFSSLKLQMKEAGGFKTEVQSGAKVQGAGFTAKRIFPSPFDFLAVTLQADTIPSSPARRSLTMAICLFGLFMLLGLVAIYQSVRSIVAMSERRSGFVSSVTHELKTPLTNIRMYIEMLEQGIAATPEKEQEYLGILASESARLAGLINNVLELAKLEKKTRRFHLQVGDLGDVLEEVATIIREKLNVSGFQLKIERGEIPEFAYDREVLVQVLLNLIENSCKFGRGRERKMITIKTDWRAPWVRIRLSDTGPGIPKNALRKVFDDFYRVDNDLTRKTGGTGIGLALVKKFVTAMKGEVSAANNQEAGCTITILLPGTSMTDK